MFRRCKIVTRGFFSGSNIDSKIRCRWNMAITVVELTGDVAVVAVVVVAVATVAVATVAIVDLVVAPFVVVVTVD